MIKELLIQTRSVRRYDEARKISYADLLDIAEGVRLCPSAANLQRLRICPVVGELCNAVFETLAFAAYLRPWVRPEEGERPVAYLVLMAEMDADINLAIDCGIAAEAIALNAREKGIGCCMFRSFNSDNLTRVLDKDGYKPILVISLGYPKETIVLEDAKDNLRYYRDEQGVHHVPKLPLSDIII